MLGKRTPVKLALHRGHIAFLHDVVMAAVAFLTAVYLRTGADWVPNWEASTLLLATVTFTGIAALTFLSSGMYKGVWRYASVDDLVTLSRAAAVTVLVFTLVMFLVTRLAGLPRSVMVINWFVLVALLGGPRFFYRLSKDRRRARRRAAGGGRVPVLLVGAGDDADLFIRAIRAPDAEYRAVGLLADRNAGRVGRNIHGVDVLGTIDEIDAVIADLRRRNQAPHRLVITDPRMEGATVRRLLDEAERLGMTLARAPRLTNLEDGMADLAKPTIRPIAVEDLLGRPQMVLDRAAMARMIQGRRVLVTGAGGSIGSELVRQIADHRPALLLLVDACEFNLYSIDLELAGRWPDLARRPLVGDVRDVERMAGIMAEHKPELVFHAAALKHVPMVEHNPDEGLLTNAVGTRVVAESCRRAGVALMVQISTDKAVNPTNVMGASKRVAEMYTQALDLAGKEDGGTRFVTVRFGNVLGSTGSVVPLFQKQLQAGGPLTVTHPDMTRYFMTVREAVELVLQASAFGLEGPTHRGKIFVLDMGEPVKIVDLARQMIRLAGLRPDHDLKIVFTGLRPGEKLFEEIFHGAEPPVPTERKGILVAEPRAVDLEELGRALNEMEAACRAHHADAALAVLRRLVPEYVPQDQAAALEAVD